MADTTPSTSDSDVNEKNVITITNDPPGGKVSRGDDINSIDNDSLGVDFEEESTAAGSGSTENAEQRNLKDQTRKTSVLRCLVITTLLTACALVANIALIIALNKQEDIFKEEYTILAHRLVDRFFLAIGQAVSAADSLASQASTSLLDDTDNNQGPNHSIPNFEAQADGFRRLSSSTLITYSPILKTSAQRTSWEEYAAKTFDATTRSQYQSDYVPHDGKYDDDENPLVTYRDTENRTVDNGIYVFDEAGMAINDTGRSSRYSIPIWQVAPFSEDTQSTVMYNQMGEQRRRAGLTSLVDTGGFIFSDFFFHNDTDPSNAILHDTYAAPLMNLYFPVHSSNDGNEDTNEENVIGALGLEVGVEFLFEEALFGNPDEPMTVTVDSSCGSTYSFHVRGNQVDFLGMGDIHDTVPSVGRYELVGTSFEQFESIVTSQSTIFPAPEDAVCNYKILVYPTIDFYDYTISNRPILVEAGVGLVFLFTIAIFLGYDCMVERRQRRMLQEAQRSNAIVSSLFPKGVRDRLYKQAQAADKAKGMREQDTAPKQRLKSFITTDSIMASGRNPMLKQGANSAEPIADLFPEATVLFADVSGFTAWSSEREPSQVFVLLETLYGGIDNIARKLGVFKVETVGDCYVAATGIPEAREDHAIVMVRFANAMLKRVNELTSALESTLGPGTADLCMRVGVHSGPVTAGVLRGEKSRFQLFGDTMNTASRMESTSMSNRIQLSYDTANLLSEAGKSHWITPREDLVAAKGKGEMQTFWLVQEHKHDPRHRLSLGFNGAKPQEAARRVTASITQEPQQAEIDDRLIDWVVQVMMSLIEKVAARRGKRKSAKMESNQVAAPQTEKKTTILQEVTEVIGLPKFDPDAVLHSDEHVTVPSVVRSELRDYVAQIAASYNNNSFHNFQHASHVCLSAHKLLKRITRPDEVNYEHRKLDVAMSLHQHTYGISSDPLAQLAMVFCALIHDAGHTGVPNGQLAKEFPAIAVKYENRSIAEQRSIDISWELLMAPCYSNLRSFMFYTKEEEQRFRQLTVNTVMATDIFDKEMAAIRKARWAKAFGPEQPEWTDRDTMDRKATVVLEHVMQASDVAHTMQHWHVYIKWNENLFQEMYKAFAKGRSEKDPSEGWYKGELWFFDNYVIPLAKKLKECGVFGVSSDEYLNYALENREEWEQKGQDIVKRMHEKMVQQTETECMSQPKDARPEEDLPPQSIEFASNTTTAE